MKEIETRSFDVIGHVIVHHVTILKRRKHKIESLLEDTSITQGHPTTILGKMSVRKTI